MDVDDLTVSREFAAARDAAKNNDRAAGEALHWMSKSDLPERVERLVGENTRLRDELAIAIAERDANARALAIALPGFDPEIPIRQEEPQ